MLSTTGRAVRVDLTEGQELTAAARRSKHDAILATASSTTRGELGAVTTAGRVLRFSPVDLPSVPARVGAARRGRRRCTTISASTTRASG